MLQIEQAHLLLAVFMAYTGWRNLRERERWRGAFWLILAALFGSGGAVLRAAHAGHPLPAQIAGAAVIALALIAPRLGQRRPAEQSTPAQRQAWAQRLGHRLLLPALLIPIVTVAVALGGDQLQWHGLRLFDPAQMTLTGLALACLLALGAASAVTGQAPSHGLAEGRRLLDTMGWAALLPVLLAALGQVFTRSGVGEAIAQLTTDWLPAGSAVACLLAYALGMVLFTVIMGNAFAAFPVMTAGIGLPLLVQRYGANPAVLGALGMLCGYCGTLLTPMAANFNLVPAALLELRSPYGVIRAQVWTAVLLFAVNLALMMLLVFR
ncbi:5-oxoproline transporter, DUF979 family subunit [Dyella sp.]|uniref:5-oxoproline transporter, DUF979 family subunit n=1 Tax=Dyella sp. TaxID=1869338 RepID=UPI002D79DD84|nr:DUF979 family protein [Dyella sp.]HET6432590.1 DUF979 family protein [Dyella sp.]